MNTVDPNKIRRACFVIDDLGIPDDSDCREQMLLDSIKNAMHALFAAAKANKEEVIPASFKVTRPKAGALGYTVSVVVK